MRHILKLRYMEEGKPSSERPVVKQWTKTSGWRGRHGAPQGCLRASGGFGVILISSLLWRGIIWGLHVSSMFQSLFLSQLYFLFFYLLHSPSHGVIKKTSRKIMMYSYIYVNFIEWNRNYKIHHIFSRDIKLSLCVHIFHRWKYLSFNDWKTLGRCLVHLLRLQK